MSLLAPIGLSTVAMFAAVLAGLTVVAYILKMRRRRFEVPFSSLWQRVLREKEATSLWKHLRRLLSLLLALFILGLLLFAVTEPRLGGADPDSRSVVIVLDASASMKAVDEQGGARRIDVAVQRARDLMDSMSGGDRAMLVRMDGQTTPLSRFVDDMPALRRLLVDIEPTDTPADLGRALSAAADALRGRTRPLIVLIGDGAYDEATLQAAVWQRPPAGRLDAIDLSGIEVRYLPVGKTSENVGIVAFNVRRYVANKAAFEAYIEIENFGATAAKRKLVLVSGDSPIEVRQIHLQPGERLRQIYPRLSGSDPDLRAELQADGEGEDRAASRAPVDAFPLDDVAYALLPARKRQDVLLVTLDNLYLEGAMMVYDNIAVDKLTPEAYEQALADGSLPVYSAVAFDGYTPAALPPAPTHLLFFNPSGERSPFKVVRSIPAPRITEVDPDHPVTRWLVMGDVNFDSTSVFAVDRQRGEVALARAVRDPVMAAKRDGARKIVAAGFDLKATDLTMRVAFPLLLVNTLDWFAGDDADLITTYRTGARIEVPIDQATTATEVEVTSPTSRKALAPLVDGRAAFYASEVGVHSLAPRDGGAAIDLATNLASPSESDIEPSSELVLGGQTLKAPDGFSLSRRQALWGYLVLVALALLVAEWVTYHRRVTV